MSISNRKQEAFVKGKKIRKVTRMPDWALKLRGRIDGRKGSEVPDAYLEKLYKRLKSFDDSEVRTAENILSDSREQALASLNSLSDSSHTVASTQITPNDGSPKSVRNERAARGKVANAKASSANAAHTLYSVNERIISVNTHLKSRIDETYMVGLKKCKAYVYGVRHKLPDYDGAPFEMESAAADKYFSDHKTLDDAIKAASYKCINNKEEE